MAENKLVDDNYLPCSEYKGHAKDTNGVARFEHNGEFYFSILDESDNVILRSEGYKAEKGRENGIESVSKNMPLEERYNAWQLPDGQWVLSLKAGNHQEIGRSCPCSSESEARAFLPSERAKKLASKVAPDKMEAGAEGVKLSNDDDNYLGCNIYESNLSQKSKYPDFISFKHSNGQFYFAWVSGNILVMRSEGYATESARDNGIESVIKNRTDKSRYGSLSAHGAHFVTLKAGNNQEIARSCPKKSEEDAWGVLRTTAIAGLFGLTTSTSKMSAADLKSAASVTTSTPITSSKTSNSNSGGAVLAGESKSSGCMKWLWPLLLLALLAGLLWWFWNQGFFDKFLNKSKEETTEVVVPAKDTAVVQLDSLALATKAMWDSTLGKMVEVKLADGTTIMVPENGSERKLVDFLNSGCKGDLKKTWFNLDRVLFKTGSTELNEVSHEQLGVLTTIFKAYSNAKFKFGGYTDNVGAVDLNKKLSGERAASAAGYITTNGIDTARVHSEGYGPEHPECPANDTEECKAKNRRVAIRVEQCN